MDVIEMVYSSNEFQEVLDLLLGRVEKKTKDVIDIEDIVLSAKIESRVRRKLSSMKGKDNATLNNQQAG